MVLQFSKDRQPGHLAHLERGRRPSSSNSITHFHLGRTLLHRMVPSLRDLEAEVYQPRLVCLSAQPLVRPKSTRFNFNRCTKVRYPLPKTLLCISPFLDKTSRPANFSPSRMLHRQSYLKM